MRMRMRTFYEALFSVIMILLGIGFSSAFSAETQYVELISNVKPSAVGQSFTISVNYDAYDPATPDTHLVSGGIGIRVFFDDTKITYASYADFVAAPMRELPALVADSSDLDGNSSTNSYLQFSWTDFDGQWPSGTLPQSLGKLNFTLASTEPTAINCVIYQTALAASVPKGIDWIPPAITVTGSNPTSIKVGATYTDEGATATDNVDGTVTVSNDASTAVNTATPGEYTVTYTATDAAGNQATATRTVNVVTSDVSAADSTFTKDPAAGSIAADGTAFYTFTVTAKKDATTPVAGVDVVLSIENAPAGLTFDPATPVSTDANGLATVKLTSTKAGTFPVNATADGVSLTPVTVTFDPGLADHIVLTSSGPSVNTNGLNSVTVTATVVDINNNPISVTHPNQITFNTDNAAVNLAGFDDGAGNLVSTIAKTPTGNAATAVLKGNSVNADVSPPAVVITATDGTITQNTSISVNVIAKQLTVITVSGNATPDLCAKDLPYTALGTFDDTSSEDVTNTVTWSVTNGTGSGTITAAGLFTPQTVGTVTIKAEDPANAAVFDTHDVTIGAAPAMSVNTATLPAPFIVGGNWDFGAAVSGGCPAAAAPLYNYAITLPVGGTAITTEGVFTPSTSGEYTLTATDSIGTAVTHTVTVNCDVDITDFTATSATSTTPSNAITIINGDTVNFAATVTGTVKATDGWLWTFGDTFTDTTANTANHRYLYDEATTTLPVTVNATLTVTSAHTSGCTATSITIPVTIQPCDAVADFTASTRVTTVNDATGVAFTNAVTTPPTGVNYAWAFGNDSDPVSSTDPSPASVKYTTPGVKTVVLTATGATGCFNTKTMLIYVNDLVATCPLLPGFNTVPATGIIVGEEVTFTDSTTGTPTAAPTTVSWDTNDDGNFELAGTGTPAVGTKTFTEAVENLTVIQKVVDGTCNYYAAGEPITVTCDAANAAITTEPSPATVVSGGTVKFTGLGSPETVKKYSWWLGTDTTVAPFCDGLTDATGCQTITPPPFTTNATITMRAYGTNNCAAVPDATVAVTVACDVTTASVTPATVALPCTGALNQKFTAASNLGTAVYKWWLGTAPPADGSNPTFTGAEYTLQNVTAPTTIYMRAYNAAGTCYVQKTATVTAATGCVPSTYPSVTAAFSGTPTSGPAYLSVKFTDASTSTDCTLSSWSWTFGDGGTSTEQNPTYIYKTPGLYTVSLTASCSGASDTMTKTSYITVDPGCTASFLAEAVGNAEGEILFDASGSLNALTYEWNFGDGTFGTGAIAPHAYAQDGTYTVKLKITGAEGCVDIAERTIVFTDNCLASASFTAVPVAGQTSPFPFPLPGTNTLTVEFDAEGSIGDTFAWSFGDGESGTGKKVSHTYASAKAYTVTLTVTAAGGCTAAETQNITVGIGCAVNADFTTFVTEDSLTASFSAYSTNGTVYTWNFGDGTAGTGMSANHTYAEAGVYTVKLTVTGATSNCAAESTQQVNINVVCDQAVAQFDWSADGRTATFDTAGSFGELSFDYGDGQIGTDTTHTYAADGTYTVKLTAVVRTADGQVCTTDSAEKAVMVEEGTVTVPPKAVFTASVNGLTVSFDTTGSVGTLTFDYGDGQTGTDTIHTYSAPGTYIVKLTAVNAFGTDESTPQSVTVTEPPVVCDVLAEFTAVPLAGDKPLTVKFDAAGSKGETFAWNFGDGNTAAGMQAEHTYNAAGEYTVVLTVTGGENCETETDTDSVTIFVTEPAVPTCPSAVVAKFIATPGKGPAPLTVTFSAEGSSEGTYAWKFSDGTTAAGKTVTHTYNTVGTYTATLTVTVSKTGCPTLTATSDKTVEVEELSVNRPDAPVLAEPKNGAVNVILQAILKAGAFKSPANAAHKQTVWQIAEDSGFGKMVFSLLGTGDDLTSFEDMPEFILNPGATYYWRVRYIDENGLFSDWSEVFSFTTVGVDEEDLNGNGVPDNQEVTNPPSVLANGLWVKVLTGEGYIGIEGLEGVGNMEEDGWFKWIDVRTTESMPGIKFPWGMCTWKIKANAKTVKVKVHFSKAMPAEALWYNYNVQNGWLDLTDNVEFAVDMKSVTITFTDGGAEDADGVVNGWIVDPAGFGVVETTTACCEDESDGGSCFIETAASGKVFAGLFLTLITGLSLLGFRKSQK